MLGVTFCTIRNWEKGHYQPPPDAAKRIVAWLGYNPKYR